MARQVRQGLPEGRGLAGGVGGIAVNCRLGGPSRSAEAGLCLAAPKTASLRRLQMGCERTEGSRWVLGPAPAL